MQRYFLTLQIAILLPALISCSKTGMNSISPITTIDTMVIVSPPTDSSKLFLALGDSYTIGQSVSEVERFPNQAASILRQSFTIKDPAIIATTGWTTRNLIDAINAAALQNNYDVVTLLIGVNNQYQGRSIDEYKTEFSLLLNRAIQYAGNKPTHVFVLSIPDYSVTPFASGSDKAKNAAEIDQFNFENKKISLQSGVHYIDITPISREPDPSLIATDGLHPSGKQYKRWVDLLVPEIRKAIY